MKMIKTKLNGKYELILPEHRANREEWHNEVGWERARVDSMHDHLGKGDVIYYVGSELGEMPALCQVWGAEVVNIEPNHSAWPSIRRIWEANNLDPPLFNFAGFASNETALVPKSPDWALNKNRPWRLHETGWPRYADGEIVEAHGFSELYLEADGLPQIKLDDLITKFNIKPPTAITFDCEGSDWEVLRGAENILKTYHPKIWASIHPEFMYHQYKEYSRNFRDWIIDHGYTEHILDYQHELHCYYEPNGKPSK